MVVLWTAPEFSYILVVVILMYILNVNEIISILGGHLSSNYFATPYELGPYFICILLR